MNLLLNLALIPVMSLLGPADRECLPRSPAPGPGVEDPFRAPAPAALQLNFDARQLYRDRKWDEARAKYRAALSADPGFLAPRLNIACSFVRQERFAEATAEVEALLAGGHVPWAREILDAADLGALKVRPEMSQIRAAMTASAQAWSADLDRDLLFVARTKAPIDLGGTSGDGRPGIFGVFILGLHQEVFAWSPRTGRYRQLTASDGRVLALSRSSDGRRLAYVTAEKLVRSEGRPAALRGLAVQVLDLGSMTLEQQAPIDGDVWRLAVGFKGQTVLVEVKGDRLAGIHQVAAGRLEPRSGAAIAGATALTPDGVAAGAALRIAGPCPVTAHELRPADRPAVIEVRGNRTRRTLSTRFGAGLRGLSLPVASPATPGR